MSELGQPNPDLASSPRTRRARRPPQSCEPCRRRKVRCDLEMPCSACRQSRGRVNCTYRSSARVSSSVSNPEPAIASVRAQQPLFQETPRAPEVPRPALSSATPATIEERLLSTERRMHSIEKSISSKNGHTANLPESSRSCLAPKNAPSTLPEAKGLSVVPTTPLMRNTTEKVKLFGSSHWLHTAAKVLLDSPSEQLLFLWRSRKIVELTRPTVQCQ